LSAHSSDGVRWRKERGVRIECQRERGEHRVLSPTVIESPDGSGYRVYFESSVEGMTSIASARSNDGLVFERDPGIRLAIAGASVGSPRVLALRHGRVRLYFHRYLEPFAVGLNRGNHVESAVSDDGLSFVREPGVRIAQTTPAVDDEAVYCAYVIALPGGRVRAFYSAWNGAEPGRGVIMTALSPDGLTFEKDPEPCIGRDGILDAVFASEPCVFVAGDGQWRMLYEGADARRTTRILAAVAVAGRAERC
jgi:hypothetical protein